MIVFLYFYLIRISQVKVNLIVIGAVLLFNECIIYRLQRLRWDSVKCETGKFRRLIYRR